MIMTRFVSLGVVSMPVMMQTYGTKTFCISLLCVLSLNCLSAWMINTSINFFTNENLKITHMNDLTYLCFNDGVGYFRQATKVLSSILTIVCLNIYLSNETESIVKLITGKSNDKY